MATSVRPTAGDREQATDLTEAIQVDWIEGGGSPSEDGDRYEMIVAMTAEVRTLLGRLAAEVGTDEIDVVRRAIGLYQISSDAHRAGKLVAILDRDLTLEAELVGFDGGRVADA